MLNLEALYQIEETTKNIRRLLTSEPEATIEGKLIPKSDRHAIHKAKIVFTLNGLKKQVILLMLKISEEDNDSN